MKNTYRIFLIVFTVASILTGCNLDVNVDPNRVTESTVTGDLIFPAAAHETGQRIASGNFTFLNNWVGYFSGSGTFAIDATETTYNITPDFGNTLWSNHINTLFDLHLTEIKSLEKGDKVLAGASIILSARLWQDLVDIYGDIPYSQAFDIIKYPHPTYDKGQDIYNDLQSRLDLAISYMGEKELATFAALDIVNKGNKTKWIKFANTLKLRMLIHQSEISGFNPAPEIAKIIANGGVLHSGETVSVNPGYTKQTNKQSPFYDNYGKTVNDADAAPSVKANAFLVDLLESYNDQREYRYFDSTTIHSITPTVYGLTAGNPTTASGVGPGLANNPAQDQWILTSVESMFLEAEAIARGWMPGVPEEAFKAAVTESFIFLNVSNKNTKYSFHFQPDASDSIVSPKEEASAYLDSASNAEVADYSTVAGESVMTQVKFIVFQKYLALVGTDPVETWVDLRRLDMDDLLPVADYLTANPSTISQTIPVRLLYPQNEYTTNTTNVNAQGVINQFTSKIFWDVN